MLFTSIGDDIDVDILSALWPKNWNAAQLLLKEEGFSDAKEYYICICREAKENYKGWKNKHEISLQPHVEHYGKPR